MIIKLTPNQIPKLWEAIKYAIAQINDISKENQSLYLNRLLHALLSSRAQCIVRMDEDKKLLGIAITRLIRNNTTGKKDLFIECLYSFALTSMDIRREFLDLIIKFAKKEKCSIVTAYSSNPKIFEAVKDLGFSERYRYFVLEV